MNKEQLEATFKAQLDKIDKITCSTLEDEIFKLESIFIATLKLLEDTELDNRALRAYIEIKNGKDI